MRLIKKNIIINLIYNSVGAYKVSSNLTYFWNFGSLALLGLIIQIISGITLSMHYVPHIDLAFLSVEHIMRDVNYGWLFRYIHSNGASFFFIVVYIHVFRGLFFGSYMYPRHLVWITGVFILLIMILTAFMGYVLPWGQMSFWGATVITNLCSAIPYIGFDVVYWLWGGFSIDNATLNRFFSFHFVFPFLILGLVGLHIIFLHEAKSNNPLGLSNERFDSINFNPYFIIKDIVGVFIALYFFSIFIFFFPNFAGHPDNYIPANPLITPAHIVPEWYFLPFYAILRSIPDKLLGVILMLCSILILILLPFLGMSNFSSGKFRPLYRIMFWFFFINSFILGWIGGKPIKYPYFIVGQYATIFYFSYFCIILPLIIDLEFYVFKIYYLTNYFKFLK
jgi:quinol-cytochrome oxidoreductase complex cytochrome b subunit